MTIKELSKEDRLLLLSLVFGEWKERAELNAILFPDSKQKSSAMSQLIESGKSSEVITPALETLLSVEPMARGEPPNIHGAERASGHEFTTDVKKFFENAKQYYRRYGKTLDCESIKRASEMISSLSTAIPPGKAEGSFEFKVIAVLWQGIIAMISNMHNVSFSLMKELSIPLGQAISDSSRHGLPATMEMLRKVLAEKMGNVWKHALLGAREARDSFAVYSLLMGETVPPAGINAFCNTIPGGERRVPHYRHRTRSE